MIFTNLERMRNSKKGTEKPIEIFIALFVILAVAMVLLKMFGGQITEKQKELKRIADQNKLKMLEKDIKNFCEEECAEVESTIDKVTYCKTQFPGSADLNDNGIDNEYYADLSVVGVCEDTIYCTAVTECKSYTVRNCVDIMCNYFRSNWGLTDDEATTRLKEFITPGTCEVTPEEKKNHWYYLLEDEITCG